MKADFTKFVGRDPAPAELPLPKDWRQLEEADPSMVSEIRHKLAIREARMREEERGDAPA